ncbi:MAG TPA: hypothetical protein DEV93_03645 [Chloroflexi bacterium]|nr:hypothetical protein [Chloroflexota bacterium]
MTDKFVPQRERHLVQAAWSNRTIKLVQLQFLRDGFAIHMAYQPRSSALLARCDLNGDRQETLDLLRMGRSTSHKIKYTHHADGRCHFSQDRKVLTAVKTQASPLSESLVHIFTIEAQGLAAFDSAPTKPTGRYSHSILQFNGAEEPPRIRVVGRWMKVNPEEIGSLRNPVTIGMPDGTQITCLGFAPPARSQMDGHVILVNSYALESLTAEVPFLFLVVGGFSKHLADPGQPATIIMAQYPAPAAGQVESIDFV